MMKMAAVCEIVLLLLWATITSSADSPECTMYATTGMDITITLHHQIQKDFRLRWKHDNTYIFDRKGDNVVSKNPHLVDEKGSLKLTKVQKAQSGLYTPEVLDSNGRSVPTSETTRLCVFDPLPKPKVEQKCLSSNKEVQFNCIHAKITDGVSYKWLQGDKEIKDNKSSLKIKTNQVETTPIRCTVANKASNMTSDPVTQTCITTDFFSKEFYGVSVWIFVAGGGGIVLVLILITIVCCVQAKRKKTMRVKDEEELRLGWTNQQPQHQHQHDHPPDHPHRHRHHHHHQHQQPAGNTGPRQQRTKQPRPRAPDPVNGQPQPNPRRAQLPKPPADDEDQPPPLPQPRKKGPKTPKM